jgi:hypothetical protein
MAVQPVLTRWALFVVSASLFADCCTTAAADEREGGPVTIHSVADAELNDLLEMLDARRILAGEGGYRWSFTSERLTVPMPGVEDYAAALVHRALHPLAGARKDEEERFDGEVTWQPSTNRFLFSASFIQKWVGGAAEYLGEREQIAFDGEAWWEFQAVRPGTELPLQDFTRIHNPAVDWIPTGTITTEVPPGGRLEHVAAGSGFIFRPGYMALPDDSRWGVSVDIGGFLRELAYGGNALNVQEDGERVHIRFLVQDTESQPGRSGELRLTFNMAQLAAIERITYFGDGPGGKRYRTADYSIRNTEVSPGVWFPQEIIWGNWMNPLVTRVQITDVQLVESLRTADFHANFPPGTQVADHRHKAVIIESNDTWAEVLATKEYAARYLGRDSGEHGSPRSGTSFIDSTLLVGSIFLILGGLWYVGRRWRKRRVVPHSSCRAA